MDTKKILQDFKKAREDLIVDLLSDKTSLTTRTVEGGGSYFHYFKAQMEVMNKFEQLTIDSIPDQNDL